MRLSRAASAIFSTSPDLPTWKRNGRQNNRLAVVPAFLDDVRRTHHDRAAAGGIGVACAALAEHHRAGREIGAGDDRHQFFEGDVRAALELAVDHRERRINDFAKVVRRDVGRHADRDAARAVDEQVRETRREHRRLVAARVIVGLEVDGILVEVVQQHHRGLGKARFGIAHRRRRIGVHRAEIALTVDQRHAERPVLRHAGESVINRAVAVRVVVTHDVADDLRRFLVRAAGNEAAFLRRVEDAAMHRLQPVAHVGQRAADDHAHRVIEVRRLHFVDDVDRRNAVVGRRQMRIFFGQSPAFCCAIGRCFGPSP